MTMIYELEIIKCSACCNFSTCSLDELFNELRVAAFKNKEVFRSKTMSKSVNTSYYFLMKALRFQRSKGLLASRITCPSRKE